MSGIFYFFFLFFLYQEKWGSQILLHPLFLIGSKGSSPKQKESLKKRKPKQFPNDEGVPSDDGRRFKRKRANNPLYQHQPVLWVSTTLNTYFTCMRRRLSIVSAVQKLPKNNGNLIWGFFSLNLIFHKGTNYWIVGAFERAVLHFLRLLSCFCCTIHKALWTQF